MLLKLAGVGYHILLQTRYYYVNTAEKETIFDGWLGTLITSLAFIAFIGFFVWLAIRSIMRYTKKQAVKNFIHQIESNDPFWNEKKMKLTAEVVYNRAIKTWAKKNTLYISEYASKELINEWENIWGKLGEKGQGFHCTSADIDSITIVNAKDSSFNNKDSFTVEIAAYTIRYVYDLKSRQPIAGHYNGKNLVYDHFIFTRKNNTWVLTDVEFYTQLNDSIKLRSKLEKPGKPEDI